MQPFATSPGTAGYRERFLDTLPPKHFKEALGLVLSSIGLGTYLGDPDPATDLLYQEAVKTALRLGCNVIDTAINYRFQRSEKSIGRALRDLLQNGSFSREEIFISTKGGFIPYQDTAPLNSDEYIHHTFISAGIITPQDITAGCHCMAPRYLEHQLQQSLDNLQLECIDLYFLHNPETQLQEIVRDEFNHRVRDAFATLEKAVEAGKIRFYGTATWNGYRSATAARDHLSLGELIGLAEEVAGKEHHFRALQLPFNLVMPESFTRLNQQRDGDLLSLLEVAQKSDMLVMASASIYQGNLARNLPLELTSLIGQRTDAQNAIQFVRSTPGITTALVGMKNAGHVVENMQTALAPPLDEERYMCLYRSK
ncbi:MAG TPA: aldo/keto reductase [Acidobacteriota bacterium]|jgi:aryl-alcohol dehydrogenase-like predicted oxidoreductase